MPYVHIYDSQLGTAGALAGNVGLFNTGQDQFNNQLRANADQRAQDASDRQSDSSNDSAYQFLIGDITRRAGMQNQADIAQGRFGNQQTIAGMNIASREGIAAGHDATRTYGIDTRAGTAADSLASKESMFWDGSLPYKYLAEGDRNNRAQDTIDAQTERAQIAQEAQKAHYDAIIAQRQLESQQRGEIAAGRIASAQMLAQKRRQISAIQAELHAAATMFNTAGVADATTRLRALTGGTDQPVIPQPAPAQVPPQDNVWQSQPQGIDATQPIDPQAAGGPPPPTHIRDGQGITWEYTGQSDPQTGEPLYQSVA